MTDELTFRTLDLGDESPESVALRRGWVTAFLRGFHQQRATDDYVTKVIDAYRAEQAVVRGAWAEPIAGLTEDVPVATFAHFVKSVNAGLGPVAAQLITDVTVAPTHRRRGIMRRLMTENLDAAVAAGLPVALLTASEGAIYQRFGFGAATRESRVRVDTSSRFRLRRPLADDGRTRIVEDHQAWPLIATVLADDHAHTRGSVARPVHYQTWYSGFDWEEQGTDRSQRYAVHWGADGRPDGFVVYAVKREPERLVQVRDLVATTPTAHLALWQFVADIDLADRVTAPMSLADPLPHALVDARVIETTGSADHLWVRLLDVPAALVARPWFADGHIVLHVTDPLGHVEGRYAVSAQGGHATVTRTESEPEVSLDVETLGTLWLGDVAVDTLVRAGRLEGTPEALHRFGEMADGGPLPWCDTHF